MAQKVNELTVEELVRLMGKAIEAAPKTFFTEEVERIVDKKFEEERRNFWVPAEQHYLDHKMQEDCFANRPEWVANHEFVSAMRGQGQKVWNIGFKMAVVASIGFMIAIFSQGARGFIAGLFK